jgi:hypothetical protein
VNGNNKSAKLCGSSTARVDNFARQGGVRLASRSSAEIDGTGSEKQREGEVVDMKSVHTREKLRSLVAVLCTLILLPGDTTGYAQQQLSTPVASATTQAAKIPTEQLDSLVAPIALHPDPLLAQVFAASTYPLQIIMLQRWLEENSGLKDKQLADAVAKQPWDPAVQQLAPLTDVVKRLGDDIQWTVDLGNAFLAQQSDVMDSVQRMRKKAHEKGSLKTTEQQKVETRVIESKSVIVIEQANPQVVYVPSYNPTVVWGAATILIHRFTIRLGVTRPRPSLPLASA